jgi:hypothetical protein
MLGPFRDGDRSAALLARDLAAHVALDCPRGVTRPIWETQLNYRTVRMLDEPAVAATARS